MENKRDILLEALSKLKTEAIEKERIVHTGLKDAKAKIILDSIMGQLSDGIWENSKAMEKYWQTSEIDKDGNEFVINLAKYGPFYGKPDTAVLAWFGNKVKQIIKQEIADGEPNMKWDRTCVVKSEYLSRGKGKEVVVKDAYRVYDALMGRKQRVIESLESDNPNYGISFDEFLNNCFMQGGNWTKMLMTGIQNLFPEYYEQMPDKTYSFEDVTNILNNDLGINTSDEPIQKGEEALSSKFNQDAKKILAYTNKNPDAILSFDSITDYLDSLNSNNVFNIPKTAPGFKARDVDNITEEEAEQYIELLLANTNLKIELNKFMQNTINIGDKIDMELGTNSYLDDDGKIKFNYMYVLGRNESPIVTQVIKNAIEKVKTKSPTLVNYCDNIQADTYAVEGPTYGLAFTCDLKGTDVHGEYFEESTNNISGITDNDKLEDIANKYNTDWRIYAPDYASIKWLKPNQVESCIVDCKVTFPDAHISVEDDENVLIQGGVRFKNDGSYKKNWNESMKDNVISEGYNCKSVIQSAKNYPGSFEILYQGRLRYKGISVSYVYYTNPNNSGSNTYLTIDANNPEFERAFDNKVFSNYQPKDYIDKLLRSGIEQYARETGSDTSKLKESSNNIPMVIYKDLGGYKVTTKSNYEARIQDARKIQDASDFDNPQEIIDYYVKYFESSPADFTIIESIKEDFEKPLTNQSLLHKVLEDGFIYLDAGEVVYVVTKVSDDTFYDIKPRLKQQLIDEDLYDSAYIGFYCFTTSIKDGKYSIEYLPIYGDAGKYVTSWFYKDPVFIIKKDLRSRRERLLSRANSYLTNTQLKEDYNDYKMLMDLYSHRQEFKDINKQSGNINDLVDNLDNGGVAYEILQDCPKGGCTVFYDQDPLNESNIGSEFESEVYKGYTIHTERPDSSFGYYPGNVYNVIAPNGHQINLPLRVLRGQAGVHEYIDFLIMNEPSKQTPNEDDSMNESKLVENNTFNSYALRAFKEAGIDSTTVEEVVKKWFGILYIKLNNGKYIAIYEDKKFPVAKSTISKLLPLSQDIEDYELMQQFYAISTPRLVDYFKSNILPDIVAQYSNSDLFTKKAVNDGNIYGDRYEYTELGQTLSRIGAEIDMPMSSLYYWGS